MVRVQTTLTRSSSPNSRAMEVPARKACACIKQAAGCANSPGTRNTAIALCRVQSRRSGVSSIEQSRTSAMSIEGPQSRSVQSRSPIRLTSLQRKAIEADTYVWILTSAERYLRMDTDLLQSATDLLQSAYVLRKAPVASGESAPACELKSR